MRAGLSVRRLLALLSVLLPAVAAASEPAPVVRFDGGVRVILPLPDGLLVAGPGRGREAWFAVLDPELRARSARVFTGCGRCSLLAGTLLGDGRALLAGARDPSGDGVEEGWVVLLDAQRGEVLAERIVRPPAGGRFLAAAAGYGRLLVAGEMFTDAGAGLDAWMVELDPETLEPRDEWRFGGPLPDAAAVVLPVGVDAFLAAGWRFSAETGILGGWAARFGADPRPVWTALLDGDAAFDVAALVRTGTNGAVLLGHDSRPDEETRTLMFDLRVATLDIERGATGRGVDLRDPAIDRMGIAVYEGSGEMLVLAARQGHPDGPDALELLALSAAGEFRSLDVWRDGERATVPAAMAPLADGGLAIGGWYRVEEGEEGPRGWLLRLPRSPIALRPSSPDGLVLDIAPAGERGRVRVILENRGMRTREVNPLGPDTVFWLTAADGPAPAQIGAMPGRAPDPAPGKARVRLPPGGRLEAVLEPGVAPEDLPEARAAYSPDFTGRGIGRLIVSAPLSAAGG